MNSQNPQTRLIELLQPLITRPIRVSNESPAPLQLMKTGSEVSPILSTLPPVALERLYPRGIRELASPLAD